MNRTEWDASNDPRPMLDWLRARGSERKFRLLACAAARRLRSVLAVYYPEAAREIDRNESQPNGAGWPAYAWRSPLCDTQLAVLAKEVSEATGADPAVEAACGIGQLIETFLVRRAKVAGLRADVIGDQRRGEAALTRDLFGHLFHSNPLWLARLDHTDEVERIARAIYGDHSFSEMPVLADALEDAGCVDAEVLEHCRDGSEHARGCWVIDAILGRS
jgi:hypothetical protein